MIYKPARTVKIYEALSALLDERIEYTSENSAKVYSSDKSKFYDLAWNNELDKFYSTDNAAKWQSTLGYPIIAILIDKHVMKAPETIYSEFSGIDWKERNKKHKNDYEAAALEVIEERFESDDRKALLDKSYLILAEQLSNIKIEKTKKSELI